MDILRNIECKTRYKKVSDKKDYKRLACGHDLKILADWVMEMI